MSVPTDNDETETSTKPEEEAFFQGTSERIAARRNARGLTEVQDLCFFEQQVLAVEKGRRVPVSSFSELSKVLGVAVGDLLGSGQERPPQLRRT